MLRVNSPSPSHRIAHAVVAVTATIALTLQFVLIVHGTWNGRGILYATIRLLSFFTIQSNLLVALTSIAAATNSSGTFGKFLTEARVRGAIAVYIAVTGGIYLTILRGQWSPGGAQWLADVLLHYLIPLTYLGVWIIVTPGRSLHWIDGLPWLIFPLCYLVWTLWRGSWAHEYPYPFVDVDSLGLTTVLRNSAAIGVLLLIVAELLIALNRCSRIDRPPD